MLDEVSEVGFKGTICVPRQMPAEIVLRDVVLSLL